MRDRGPLLCAIAKDEGAYVREWVGHHLRIGFSRVVIYDNDSTDGGVRAALGAGYDREVTVRAWTTQPGTPPQRPAYDDCLARDGDRHGWVMFLDIDEFLNLKRHDTVSEFLRDYDAFDGVAVHWRLFGSSGLSENDGRPVLERFVRASHLTFTPNAHVKTIFRPSAVLGADVHSPRFKYDGKLVNTEGEPLVVTPNASHSPVRTGRAQVNHYFTKSRAEFRLKRLRGRADIASMEDGTRRADSEFQIYDRNEEEDLSILRFGRLALVRGGAF